MANENAQASNQAKKQTKLEAKVEASGKTTKVLISGPIDRAVAAFMAEVDSASNNVTSLKAALGPALAAALKELG